MPWSGRLLKAEGELSSPTAPSASITLARSMPSRGPRAGAEGSRRPAFWNTRKMTAETYGSQEMLPCATGLVVVVARSARGAFSGSDACDRGGSTPAGQFRPVLRSSVGIPLESLSILPIPKKRWTWSAISRVGKFRVSTGTKLACSRPAVIFIRFLALFVRGLTSSRCSRSSLTTQSFGPPRLLAGSTI